MPIDLADFNPDYVEHSIILDDPRVHFKLRSRTIGIREYVCIFCGHYNRHRVRPQSFIFRCQSEDCRRLLGIGDIGYILQTGPKVAPPDLIIPRYLQEAFPQGDLARWSSGQPIHQVKVLAWPEPAAK